ncbi:MAG TPA: hypothetical protein VE174_06700 [Actinomycetota bacterium]|nr:hypothetical protein [Actinomycetota bacterium]
MKRRLIAVVLVGAFALGACGGGGDTETPDAGDAAATPEEIPSGDVSYFGTEFAFEGPATIGAGETTFTLDNTGEQPHMLLMVELLEGKTLDDVNTYIEEHGTEGRPPKWAKQVKLQIFAKPGKTGTDKPVNLTAGNYAMLCFIPDKETKKTHAELGMASELTVE